MTRALGTNYNANNEATVLDPIELNSSTATKILDAFDSPEKAPMFICINNNDAANGVWIRLMPAATESTSKKGLYLPKKGGEPILINRDSIYYGEISAIAEAGTPDIYVTYF